MIPLSEKLRPQNLSEIIGQDHLIKPGGYIYHLIKQKTPRSLLLWGPPGCGKTTIGRLYAKAFGLPFVYSSAVFQSTQDLKKILKDQEKTPLFQQTVLLFIDEIHRFNRAQQDLFLPFLEDGSLILVGATTENPSFCLNNALLSRLRVLRLHALQESSLAEILERYETQISPLPISEEIRKWLISLAQGDGRHLLNLIENLEGIEEGDLQNREVLSNILQKKTPLYDRGQEYHFCLISALHKAIRGSDPDAALYWLARMLGAGEDPLYLIRRMTRIAIEDIGLCDPQALTLACQIKQTYELLGSPEGELALAWLAVYLCLSPKSNAVYTAWSLAKTLAQQTSHLSPPSHILNAPTSFMKKMGYGKGYVYDHDTPEGCSGQQYFPDDLPPASFYHPVERGLEREMKKRMEYFSKLRHLS